MHGRHGFAQLLDAHALGVVDGVEGGHGDSAVALALEAEVQAAADYFGFFGRGGVGQTVAQHEAVKLGFGKLKRAGLLDGVLRGDDQEWGGQVVGRVSDGDAALLHGLGGGLTAPWGRRG